MDITAPFIRGLVILIAGVALVLAILVYWLRHTREDPIRLIVRWVLTLLIILFVLAPLGAALTTRGQGGAFLMVFVAVGGLMIALIWTPRIVDWVGSKFESLYTGGDRPPDPQPFYSIALAHRKNGRYEQAIGEIEKQLRRFPNDVTGQFLLAEIQAEDLRDLDAAQNTLEMFCNQPGHLPQNIWLALNTLADWQLEYNHDAEAARQWIQAIIEQLPDTPQALLAAQRLGHLGTQADLDRARDRTPLHLKPGVPNIGLLRESKTLAPQDEDPEETAARLINQLESHPLDTEAREKLAVIYSTHYRDLALAREQLEILVNLPVSLLKDKVRWLNLLADFQVHHQAGSSEVEATLQRVIDLAPGNASADRARQRLAHIKLEIKGREQGKAVAMGTYEQNIGLKKGRPPEER